jgi:hypothetical protein
MSKHITRMSNDDAEHYSAARRIELIAGYPAHEREARVRGWPSLGSGRVFPVTEEQIVCGAFAIPDHFRRIIGLDFGWNHPFAAVELAHDADADVVYVTKCYRQKEATPVIHAAAVKPWGVWIPVAWPHDGLQHKVSDQQSAVQLRKLYEDQGLNLLMQHATHEAGGYGTEAGVMEMLDRMLTGRWKVFAHLEDWLSEFRYYRRDKGLIVKERDDLLSASRVGMMMIRYADIPPREKRLYEKKKTEAATSSWAA